MAMYESLFDLSPEQTDSAAMPRTVVFSNETGSGSMTICPLFPGAELYYNDMHLVSFDEAPVLARNVIEINHCRVGRYECSFGGNSCCYLAAGDFAVCAAARKKSSSHCGTITALPFCWIWMRSRRKCGARWNGMA